MKTLFRRFGFPLLALIAIIVVLVIRGFAQPTPAPTPTRCPDPQDMKIVLKIGGRSNNDYVDLQNPDPTSTGGLEDVLNHLKGGLYKLRFMDKQGHTKDYCHTRPLSGAANIKTDKITTSEVARRAQVQGSAANDPNLMNRITSDNPTDIINVLNTLATPTPTASPK